MFSFDEPNKPVHRGIVRLATSNWSDNRGVYLKQSITYLRRKSFGHNLLEEEVSAIGSEAMQNIINLAECVDGIYEVVTCNESRDFESGHIDGYDLMLVKFEESDK